MPKETFHNLSLEKRKAFITAALEEFAHHNFDTASITQIVRKLRIAKGSVYQYFEDKLDLWLHLKQYCEQIKIGYIQAIERADYPDFWHFYRAQYAHGIGFDLEHPLCSLFLYRVGYQENSPSVQNHLNTWKNQAYTYFTQWVEAEKQNGSFDTTLSTEIIVHYLLTMSLSITDLLTRKYGVNFEKNISEGRALYGQNAEEVMSAVDEMIILMKRSLQKQS